MKLSLRCKFLVPLALLAISGLAFAQNDPSGDPPTRVVRLQLMDGNVSLQPGGVDDWVPASLNRPLTTADRIWTDVNSRAELTMASAALRMGSETSVTLTNLDDNTAQIELDQGTLNLAVRYLNPGEIVEVDTPNFAYTVSKPGEYRFEVLPDQDVSWITVRRGDGEATGEGGKALRVHAGQQFSFSQGQSLNYMSTAPRPSDSFDEWCEMRERRETSSASAKYVAAGTVGYEDLDDNGSWAPSATYGTVWYPRVHEGWAPYREGHWAWVEPWGWTWVDDASWGFAPFHYGRWVEDRGRWGWVPGPVGVRPVYAPAMVAWVGGPSFGVSIGVGGGGGVGWFPLGWHDPYIPSYHVSPAYARNVNISNSRVVNVTVVNNYYSTTNVNVRNSTINNVHYENATVRGAVTGVSSSTFASGKPMRGNFRVVPASDIGRGRVMTSAAVVPTKEAVLGGHAPHAMPQHLVAPRQVVSKAAPPPRPVTFDQQRPLLEKSKGVPLAPAVRANIRANNPPPPRQQAGRPPANQQGARPGQPAANQQGAKPPAPGQPAANQQGGRPGQPAANQQGAKPPVPGQPPANNQQGAKPPAPGQPAANPQRPYTQGGPPMRNVPVQPPPKPGTTPGAGAAPKPAAPPNQPGRPVQPPSPNARPNAAPNVNQPPATQNNAPGRNVPRPPQPNGQAPAARPAETPNRPATQPPPAREAAPVQPPRNAPPAREAAPATPPRDAPPAREAAPPHNAPPAREAAPPHNAPPAREAAPAAPARTAPPPAREAAPPHNAPPTREAAPPRPARNAPPAREAAPAAPARTPPPPAAAPAPQHKAPPPPPAKENKNKDKEKEPK